jgi:hypothetical protein
MKIATHNSIYTSDAKSNWRSYIYDILKDNNCHTLIDSNNNFPYRWLEPIGEDALPFKQILSTGRIQENQLIGIDKDPKNPEISFKNVENCKQIYPQAEIYCEDWVDYCKGNFDHSNIGYIIMDLYVATSGHHFESILEASIHLAEQSKATIGEVLLVINADYGYTKRFFQGTKEGFAQETERVFKTSSRLPEFRKIKIHPESIYSYKNEGHATEMATIITIL